MRSRRQLRRALIGVGVFATLGACALDNAGAGADLVAQAFTAADNDAQLLDAEEREFLRLINQHRAAGGLAPLTATRMLDQAAYNHSRDMAARNYFSHTSQDGRTFVQRIRAEGYAYNTALAENIAAGNATGAATFAQWRDSPGHNANMLNGSLRAIGIGRAYDAASTYRWYWTTDFGGVVDPTALGEGSDAGVGADAGPRDAGAGADAGGGAVAVSGNDDTARAHVIPEGRAFVGAGDTRVLSHNATGSCGGSGRDAAFRLDLTATRDVLLETAGSGFDTVLHVRRASDGARACNDNVSATDRSSRLWLRLPPARYEVWVDGNGTNAGPYVLRVR